MQGRGDVNQQIVTVNAVNANFAPNM